MESQNMSGLVERRLGLTSGCSHPVELRRNFTEDELQQVFRAAYEQVFGRERVYVGGTFASAEALLRNGDINVRQFVGILAKSELYKERFFYSTSQVRFIELNYKHLLGRAPYDQSEIAYHGGVYASSGYDQEIDSYIYSPEYDLAFGDNVVPYYRGFQSLAGMKTVGFNRLFALCRGNGNSDNAQVGGNKSVLGRQIALNLPNSIVSPLPSVSLKAAPIGGDNRVFLLEVETRVGSSQVAIRRSRRVYQVPFGQLSERYQQIHKQGGRIISVTPV
jgi:phycoerythrocyanin-associated rod linker protein